MYHRFGEDNYPSTNITIEQFERHLEEFSKPKYNVLPLELIIETFEAGGDLPENTISITVDDAYRSILTQAWPRMKKYNFPLTIFVSTEPVDARMSSYLNWEEIRELISEGVTIGAHTRTHPHLHELSVDEIKKEIEYSNKRFLKEIGKLPKLFAYPFGEASEEVFNIVKDYKFKGSFGQHSGVINETSDFNYLPRFSLNEKYGDIERVKFSANSKGMGVYDLVPADPIIDTNPPFIGFSLLDINLSKSLNCFVFDNSGKVETDQFSFGERIEIRLKRELEAGRVRMNCTAKGKDNKWRWFGHQFLLPKYLD